MADNNGGYVTRAEMGAHMRRVDDNIAAIRSDVSDIKKSMSAGPRWLGNRANAIIDKLVPAVLGAAFLWLAAEKFSGN